MEKEKFFYEWEISGHKVSLIDSLTLNGMRESRRGRSLNCLYKSNCCVMNEIIFFITEINEIEGETAAAAAARNAVQGRDQLNGSWNHIMHFVLLKFNAITVKKRQKAFMTSSHPRASKSAYGAFRISSTKRGCTCSLDYIREFMHQWNEICIA